MEGSESSDESSPIKNKICVEMANKPFEGELFFQILSWLHWGGGGGGIKVLKMYCVVCDWSFSEIVAAIASIEESEILQSLFSVGEYLSDDLLFLEFLKKFITECGISGELENHKVLYTLDRGINEFLIKYRNVWGRYLTNSDVIKLYMCLKFLLVRSTIKNPLFVPLDSKVLIDKYFVKKRQDSSNSNVWSRIGEVVNVNVKQNVLQILELSKKSISALEQIEYFEKHMRNSEALHECFLALKDKLEKIIFILEAKNDVHMQNQYWYAARQEVFYNCIYFQK